MYMLSVFTDPTTAEGEEWLMSDLAAYDLSPEVGDWIEANTSDDPGAYLLVTPSDGDFRNNTSQVRLEVRVQDSTVVTA